MPTIRTPETNFENLPDFPFPPNYTDVLDGDVRMHYLDEGWSDGEVILCLHGEPSWSFLYRHMIPILAEEYRVVAPDLIGFGRSDKFTELDEYSFQMHYQSLVDFLEALDLQNITLVCQDWGGILGLTLAANEADRFKRLVIMNTGLPTGDIDMGEGFMQWRNFAIRTGRSLVVSKLFEMSLANTDNVTPDVLAAYDAPFPDETYKAGVATFPALIPLKEDDPGAAELREARTKLSQWQKPALVMFSDSDPVTHNGDKFFRKLIPTAKDQPEITIKGAGHFLQEEKGQEIAQHIVEFVKRTS
jgi:haloalkane dehalogenase